MLNTYNVIVNVNAQFANTVFAINVETAWEKAINDTNSFTTSIANVEFTTVTGEKISFQKCENDFEVKEVFEEFNNEYTACGNLGLVVMRNIEAETIKSAGEYAKETFNDFYLSLGNVTVVNDDQEGVKLAIADYQIEVADIEKMFS